MPEDLPDRMPDRMSEDMPEDMPDRMPDRMPEDMPHRLAESVPEDMQDRIWEDLPDKELEHRDKECQKITQIEYKIMSSRIWVDRSLCWVLGQASSSQSKLSEDMSDRMPEDMSVTNV